MSRTRWYAWVSGGSLLLNLIVTQLLGGRFTNWLALVFIFVVSLGIFALLERSQHDELQQLTQLLSLDQRTMQMLEDQWIGRTVRLKEDIRNSKEPEGRQVYVEAGTLGTIVALNRDEEAPFTVLFPGFAPKVVMRLDRLDVQLDGDRVGNVPDKARAPFGSRLRPRPLFSPLARHAYDEFEDDDDVPEEAEAFVDEMEDFAGLDWFLWNHGRARLAYRQRNYRN